MRNVTALVGATEDPSALPDASLIAATVAMHHADATFVAALDGYAIGAGVELACACDLRVCTRDVYFAVPAAALGVVYHAAGLVAVREVFGPGGARRLLMLGERLSADDAWTTGALVRLCDPAAFEATLAEVLEQLRRAAPLSLRGNRDLLRRLDHGPLSSEALHEHETLALQPEQAEALVGTRKDIGLEVEVPGRQLNRVESQRACISPRIALRKSRHHELHPVISAVIQP